MGTGASTLQGLSIDEVFMQISGYFHSRNVGLQDAFQWLDMDRSGFVTWDEFLRGFHVCVEGTAGSNIPPEALMSAFTRFDTNHDGLLSIDEFVAAFPPWTGFNSARPGDMLFARDRRPSPGIAGYPSASKLSPDQQQGKVASEVIVRIASAIQRSGYKPADVFQKLDADFSGELSQTELRHMMLSFQPNLSQTEQDAVLKHFDWDRSGTVSLLEFTRALQDSNPAAIIAIEDRVRSIGEKFSRLGYNLSDAFSLFDRDGDWFLSREEWQRAMRFLGEPNEDGIEAVFRYFDTNSDGWMSIPEFQDFFQGALAQRSVTPTQQQPQQPLTQQTQSVTEATSTWPFNSYRPPPAEERWEAEVLELVRSCLSVGRSGFNIGEVFRRLDIDNTGSMSLYEFSRLVTTYRPDLTSQHVEQLFCKVNVSMSGAISRDEFVRRFG